MSNYFRYILIGIFFTILGPSVYLMLAFLLPAVVAAVLVEVAVHCLRYLIYKRFLFQSQSMTGRLTYVTAAMPISILNVTLVMLVAAHVSKLTMAVVLGSTGVSVGYIWTRLAYYFDLSGKIKSNKIYQNLEKSASRTRL